MTQSVIERPPPPEERSSRQQRGRCRSVLVQGSGGQLAPAIAKQVLRAAKEGAALARQDRRTARAIAAEERRVDRRFRKWVRNLHRRDRRFWVRVRTPKAQRIPMAPKTADRPHRRTRFSLPAYSKPIIDKLGRRGIFLSFEYDGAKRNDFGVFRRRTEYSFQSDGVRCDPSGRPIYASNMGRTPEEICEAADALEGVMRGERVNAKLSINATLQLPHDATVEEQLQIVRWFCSEVFEAHDLPYVAVLHKADKAGDSRNVHAHITFAFRPMVRVGDHKWTVGAELRTDLDGPDQFFEYRRLAAEIMTKVMRRGGHNRTYTHLSNAERGLAIIPQKKLGKAKASQVRRGRFVGDNVFNAREVEAGERVLAQAPTPKIAHLEARSIRMAMSPVELSPLRGSSKVLPAQPSGPAASHSPLAPKSSSRPKRAIVEHKPVTSAVPRALEPHVGRMLAKSPIEPVSEPATATVRLPVFRRTPPLATPIPVSPLRNSISFAGELPGSSRAGSRQEPISITLAAFGGVPAQLKRPAGSLTSRQQVLLTGPHSQPLIPVQDQAPRRHPLTSPRPLNLVPVLAIRPLRLTGAMEPLRGQTRPLLPPLRLSGWMPLLGSSSVDRLATASPKAPATAERMLLTPAAVASAIGPLGSANRLRTVAALSGSAMPRIIHLLAQGTVISPKTPVGIAAGPTANLSLRLPRTPDMKVAILPPVGAPVVALAKGRGRGATVVAGLSSVKPVRPIEPVHPPVLLTLQPSNHVRAPRAELPSVVPTRPLSHRPPELLQQLRPAEIEPVQPLRSASQRRSGERGEIEQLRLFREELADQVATMQRAQAASPSGTRMSPVKEKPAVAPAPPRPDAPAVNGEELIRRLQSERIYLVQEDRGYVLPHDRKRCSDAELVWMRLHQLDVLGVQRTQQEEIEQLAEHVDQQIEAFRNGTLKVSKNLAAAWNAFAAAPEVTAVIKKAEQTVGMQPLPIDTEHAPISHHGDRNVSLLNQSEYDEDVASRGVVNPGLPTNSVGHSQAAAAAAAGRGK